MKSIKIVFSLWVLTFAVTASAAPLLNGLALEQQFNKELYIAAIYSESLSTDSANLYNTEIPRRLEVRVLAKSLPARRFRNQWMESIAINNRGDTLSSQAEDMVTFANLFRGRLHRGDQLAVDFAADSGITTVSLNGITLGEIANPDFFNTLLRAWIGPVPPSTDFRDGLLSAGDVPASLRSTFESLEPSSERIAELQLKQIGQEEALAAAQAPQKEEELAKPTMVEVDLAPPTMTLTPATPAASAPQASETLTSEALEVAEEVTEQVAEAADSLTQVEGEPLELEGENNSEPTQLAASSPENMAAVDMDDEFEEEDEAPLTAGMILARQIYTSNLLRHTFRHIRYPKRAQERGQEGSVRLNVVINPRGEVIDIQAIQESRFGTLNREARAAVERAAPYPAVPAQLGEESFSFSLPITFNLPD
ncbi:TonB family protein [Microbulbifer sp. THAF38]|uniref:TonB family protein n=1 Tax=Microbulbifer sp. THAF38 TaxID=2587856 RepID=UPI00126923D1|nr:TonB family protein [Microbulbifer sp. THAF38]QFT53581.1 Gram-negative bacterial tonB protein [Microbulbifer sp. THAF38]